METTKQNGLLGQRCGCKVGWNYYKTREDAERDIPSIIAFAEMKASKGYDFGYCSPGYIVEIKDHPEYGHCFEVCTA